MQNYGTDSSSSAANTYYQYTPWYISRSSFKTLVIEDGVTSIGDYAFSSCYDLTSVTIPDSVTSIGSSAFSGCSGLTRVNISDLKSWCNTSFGNSSSNPLSYAHNLYLNGNLLTALIIPDNVTSIGSSAFSGCTGLTSITIPDSVTKIGADAFYGCSNLTSVTIPDSVTSIGDNAFYGCGVIAYSGTASGSPWGSKVRYNKVENGFAYNDNEKTQLAKYLGNESVVVIPDSVTSIGSSAFSGCTGITSITIPDSVTSIGYAAFYDCTGLTKVNISSLESWCNISFGDSSSNPLSYARNLYLNGNLVTKLTIPDSVTSIGNYTFYRCTGLTSVTIPDSVTSIGSSAFNGCTGLTSITIPDSVTRIGGSAFSGCEGLTSIIIPDNVTSIGRSAFAGTGYYKDESNWENNVLYIGKNLIEARDTISGTYSIRTGTKTIAEYAFSGCSDLTSITIPDSVTSIGQYTFSGCTGLTNVTIPDSVTTINYNAFDGCTGLTSITIPSSVTSIGDYAFRGCSGLTSVTIGNGVTSIGNYAFFGCTGLKELTMPCSAKINNSQYTFYNCTNIEKVTLTKGTGTMQSYSSSIYATNTYYQYTPWYISRNSLTTLVIEDGVSFIGNYAFYGCTGVKELTMPCSLRIIGNNSQTTFYNCMNIEKVTITKGTGIMQNYGTDSSGAANTYYQYTPWYISRNSFKTLVIEDGVTSIGNSAFSGCSRLTSITIPDSVTSIGSSAFSGCSGLTRITIPDSVIIIGTSAFSGCGTIIYSGTASGSPWGAKVRYNKVENGFAYNDNEKTQLVKYIGNDSEIVIPDSVTSIGNNAFSNCIGLTSITIPDSVTNIGNSAFSGCTGLTSITIPDSVTNIGNSAFSGCTGLTSITIPESVTNIGSSAFSGCGAIVYSGTASGSPWGAKVRYNKFENGFAYNDNEKTQLVKYLGNDSEVVIPDGVTSIGSSAFSGCTGLTSITIPDSVTSIGSSAFSGCTGLTSITIPDSVTSIGSSAFYGCTGLKELTMPCSANYSYAFGGCTNIEKVTLTEGTGIMKDYDSSSYMNTPWYISRNNLKEIVLEDGITKIGNYVFYDCTGLERITIPSSVTSIGNNAFNTLTEVTIPASMKIDFSGFDGCTNLQKINLTPGSGTMADWSLDYQDSLWYKHKETIKEVKLEEGIKNISESAFYECTNLAKTNVPSTVDSIGRYAYYGCDNLRNLTISSMQCKIPDNPNTISSFATIYAPSGSTAEQYAVKYNRDFESTGEYVPALIPEGASVKVNGDKAVITLSDGSTITVPKDTKETVKNTDGTYTVTLNDGKTVTVSSNTEITKTADGQLNVKATENGKITTVTVPSGSSVVKNGDSYVIKVVNGTETVEKTVAAGETVVIDKSGSMSCNGNHKWDKGVVTIAATCTSEGVKTYTCSVCGNQKIEKLKKVAHKPVADKAVPATFVSAGKTAGTHCSACGKVIVAQKPIAMLGAAKLSKVKKGKKSFTATWKPVANIDGYEIQYSLKKNMKKAKIKSVASSKKKLKVKKLKAKKKYYVRIRAYKVINGKKQYSAWSAKKKVKTK